jgi:[protein-PII] uridylyltransferase
VQSVEQMKLLTILTTADIRGVGPGVWNGWKAQLLRTLYYETEPVLTGGFSEVNRAQRIAVAQAEFRAAFTEWPEQELNAYIARHYPAYWLKVELPRKIRHARFLRGSEQAGEKLAINVGFDEARGVTELTILATDHPWLLSIIAGACASAGANIVDAQIYTTTDGRALDTIAISREYDRDEDEGRRATRIGEMIEDVLEGKLRLPEVVARRAASRKARPFVVEPEVIINNQWSDRYTVIEVSGLDRPGLLYELTTAISKLNLNIASAHVATFGERARDVFYVTDLLGAQINAPTRQAAIKSALIHLLAHDAAVAQPAA